MKDIRLIENYLDNDLKGEQLESFQKSLKEDKEFANKVCLHQEVNSCILEDDIVELRQQVSGYFLPGKNPYMTIVKFVLPVAAALVIGLALIHTYNIGNYGDAYTAYYKPYEADVVIRTSLNDVAKQKDLTPYLLYNKGKYKEAFEMLDDSVSDKPENYRANFFYGLCALELDDFNTAEKSLTTVFRDSINPTFKVHAEWYLSMLYLKNDYPDKARQHLKNLTGEHYYASKAKKILKKYY
jgi:tetratricopeptide (TPR) repeat protein